MTKLPKYVYLFGAGKTEGDASMRELLGGKGANLAEMSRLKLPVPAGFTISTEVCTYFYGHESRYPRSLEKQILAAVKAVERTMGATFGDPGNPLLFSVRSGARASMPGMMETVLNLGLNDEIAAGLCALTGDRRFTYDVYRRFVQMYGDVVMGLRPEGREEIDPFESLLEKKKEARGVELDSELSAADLEELVGEFKALIKRRLKRDFPEDPQEQLWGAVGAVFQSWQGQRAIRYRELEGIPHEWGTAVNVQAMVFGNMGADCATGVAFTRDPSTGARNALRRVPHQRPGRGRRRRHPHPRRRIEKLPEARGDAGCVPPVPGGLARLSSAITATCRTSSSRCSKGRLWMLQTRSRQAHRRRGRQDRGRHGATG